jgi:hypothetical protein
MVVVVVRQGGWTALMVAKSQENDSRQPRDLHKNRHSDVEGRKKGEIK